MHDEAAPRSSIARRAVVWFIAFALPLWFGEARADCSGSIGSSVVINGRTAYDPFSVLPRTDQYSITVTNTGISGCVFGLAFSAASTPAKLGSTLSFTLTDTAGNTVLFPAPIGATPPRAIQTPWLWPYQTAKLTVSAVIDAGQMAGPGNYTNTIDLAAHLYSIEFGQFHLQKTVPLSITYPVAQSMGVNIAGGGLATTLDFGVLSQGAGKDVRIEARSNMDYRLVVTSSNRGKLLLSPEIINQLWAIAYSAKLDGSSIDLTNPVTSGKNYASGLQGDSHAFSISIGDTSQKRAGLYKDVITITIISN